MKEIYISCRKIIDEGDYAKWFKIILLVYILLAPSYLYIFLYERKLFYSTDTVKLIVLALVLNVIFTLIIGVIMSILYLSDFYKIYVKLAIMSNNASEQNKSFKKKSVFEEIIKEYMRIILHRTVMFITSFTIIMYSTYILEMTFFNKDSNEENIRILLLLSLILILILSIVKFFRCIKEFSKVDINTDMGKALFSLMKVGKVLIISFILLMFVLIFCLLK